MGGDWSMYENQELGVGGSCEWGAIGECIRIKNLECVLDESGTVSQSVVGRW